MTWTWISYYNWHSPKYQSDYNTLNCSFLLNYFCLELGEWCHCVSLYTSSMYIKRSVFPKILHVKIWINNLDGFHVQIILISVGEREYWGYNRMELEHSLRTIWKSSSNISHRGKSKLKSWSTIYWALLNPEGVWWHLWINPLLRLC